MHSKKEADLRVRISRDLRERIARLAERDPETESISEWVRRAISVDAEIRAKDLED